MEMVHTKESRKKVTLKLVGFFRELPHGKDDGESLKDSMHDAPGPYEREAVEYLRKGVLFIASPGPVLDVFDGSGPIGTAAVYTDGVWAWLADLPYYVERYHVALPEEFLQHAKRNDWAMPELSMERLRLLMLPSPG